jgi:hypothetical protein
VSLRRHGKRSFFVQDWLIFSGVAKSIGRTIAEIQRRFKPFLENGDDSLIPPDLQRCIYTIVSSSHQPHKHICTLVDRRLFHPYRPSDTVAKPNGRRSDRVSRPSFTDHSEPD